MSTKKHIDTTDPILLFDGVCNLCNGFVQFSIKRDQSGKIKYAALQSEAGQQLLRRANMPPDQLATVVLIEKDQVFTHSDVGLRLVRQFGGLWPVLSVFSILPRFIRDNIYNWIAKNRYRFFGKKEVCMMPQPEWEDRFL